MVGLPGFFDTRGGMEPTEFDANQDFELSVVDEEKEEEQEKKKELDGQFVSQPAPEKEERPEEARFRDQFDSKADKETARRNPGTNQSEGPAQINPQAMNSQGSRSQQGQRSQPTHEPDREREPKPPVPSDEEPSDEEPSTEASADNQPSESDAEPDEAAEPSEQAVDLEEAETAEEGMVEKSSGQKQQPSKPDPSKLFPSMESAQASMGGGSVDYLRDVDEGDKTLLNRKQSRYWSFMSRLKDQVVQEWSPGEEYRRRDPRGKVYGVKDRFTSLRITLNGDGSLRTIYVASASGLDFYDDEAVRAVREAAPFPNPPEGMKDKDGLIHITFGFMLDLHTGSMRNIRIRRN
jgi:TonB family protein